MKTVALAPIEVEILLCVPIAIGSHKRLERIAGLAPEKKKNYTYRNDRL